MHRRTVLSGGLTTLAAASAARAAPQDDIAGDWDGELVGVNRTLQFVVGISRGGAERAATFWSTEQAPQPIPARARVRDGMVTVTSTNPPATIEGRVSADGRTFVARYRQGTVDLPMTLTRRARGAARPPFPGLEEGEFLVPEDRNLRGSREIAIRYLRMRSKSARPGVPVIALAGGPGVPMIDAALRGTGDLSYWRYFDRDRDVILLDQRGCGRSNHIPEAPDESPPRDLSYLKASLVPWYRQDAARRWKWWVQKGVAMSGYTTVQNAHDIDDLRKHLGLEKVCLHGGSYGSHLGLAVLKFHGAHIERVVFEGLEGLDQTIKRPSAVDAALGRLAAKVAADPAARDAYPDLLGAIRRVHQRLDADPIRAPTPNGPRPADSFAAKLALCAMLGTPQGNALIPWFYREADQGRLDRAITQLPAGVGLLPGLTPMNLAMDVASGASSDRLDQIAREARTAIVGDAPSFPHPHLKDVIPLDLGEAFRAPFRTDVPALLVNGDVDGKTPLEEAREVATQFSNASFLEVENGTHTRAGPEIPIALAFLRGEAPAATRVAAAPIRFRI